MQHLRIFVNLGFWSPCLVAKNVTDAEAVTVQIAIDALDAALPIIGNVISMQLTPEAPATAATPISTVTTATPAS